MAKGETSPLVGFVKQAKAASSTLSALAAACEDLMATTDLETVEALPMVKEAAMEVGEATHSIGAALTAVVGMLEGRVERDADSYLLRLDSALRAAGHKPEGDTARAIIQGMVYLEVDDGGSAVRLNDRVLGSSRVTAVVAAVGDSLGHLASQMAKPNVFMRELQQAYREEVRALGSSLGSQVKVADLHFRIMLARQSKGFRRDPKESTFKGYPLEVFRADLHAALASPSVSEDGSRLVVASGSDTAGAIFMLIPSLGRAGYVGRIAFEGGRE